MWKNKQVWHTFVILHNIPIHLGCVMFISFQSCIMNKAKRPWQYSLNAKIHKHKRVTVNLSNLIYFTKARMYTRSAGNSLTDRTTSVFDKVDLRYIMLLKLFIDRIFTLPGNCLEIFSRFWAERCINKISYCSAGHKPFWNCDTFYIRTVVYLERSINLSKIIRGTVFSD